MLSRSNLILYKLNIVVFIAPLLYGILTSILKLDFITDIFILILSNVILEYFIGFYIMSERLLSERKLEEKFNSDYYDLFWNFTFSRLQLLLNILIFMISLRDYSEVILNKILSISWNNKIILTFILWFTGVVVWAVICDMGKNQKIIRKLTGIKGQDYTSYSENELTILDELE